MLDGIKTNIEKLIALYESERQERQTLQQALEKSKAENESYRKQIDDLRREVDNLKLAQAFNSVGDNSAAKEKVDKLIKEMDKCIALLEK